MEFLLIKYLLDYKYNSQIFFKIKTKKKSKKL